MIGAKPYRADLPGKEKFFLIPFNERSGMVNILKSNPLLHLRGDKLCMALYMDDADFKDNIDFANYIRGLKVQHANLTEIYYRKSVEKISYWLNEEKLKDIVYIKI